MISILMPIYNGIEFIDESVLSVINQSYGQWELLIGINGHPPNSDVYQTAKKYQTEKVESNKNIKVFDFPQIQGKSNTLNEMIQHCQYNYIALLDVDDSWHVDKLKIQSSLLNIYDVIGSNCVYFGDRNGVVPKIPVGYIGSFDLTYHSLNQ